MIKRIGRRAWLILAGVVLGLAGFSWWVYYVGSARILERAEAFQYRRMDVAQLQERDVYRFFYATNRTSTPETDALEDNFGIERGETLSFGHFDTRIEPSLGLGMLIDPSDWFRDEEIEL
jgi:cytoskeletal protein RodZ